MSTQQDGEFKSENTTDTRQTEDIKSHKPESNPKDNFSLKSTIRPVRVKRTSEQETIRKTVISAELQHGTEKAHDKEQSHRKSKIAVLKPSVKQGKSSDTSVVSKEHQGSERDQCNVERRIHFSDEHENKGETRKETPRSNDAVKKTLRDKREHFRLSRSSNNSDKVSGSTSPLSDVLSIENKSSATSQGREEIPLRNLSNGSKSVIGSDKKETFHDSILKERDESKTHRRAKYPPDNNEKTQTQTQSEHIRQVSTSIKDSRKSTSDAKGDKRTFKQPFAKQFLTADIVSPEIERSKSEQRIQNQSSTETSGLGETITSGFSSQESIASVQSYQTSSKTAPEIYSHLTFQEDLGIDLREDTTRGETKDNDSFETETIDSQNVINDKNELGNYRKNIKSRFINKSGPSHSTSDGLFHVDILEREILDKPICYRPMKEQVEQHQIHFLGPTDQLNNNGASQKQGIEPIPSQELGNLEQEGSYHVVTDFDELFQQSENLPQQTMGLGIEQINNEWNRHTRSSSIKSIRSNRSSQGSFRSRSGSTRRSKRFLGEKESKWMKWGRERRASFRRRLDKLEQPEPEVPPRPSTPIKKARQEGLMFIHPDLESKYISEEDINYIQRHRQQRLQTYKVIEKSKNIRFHQDSIGLGRLTANDLNILTRFWEHRVFVRSRYISILLSFITVVIYIISICSSNWIIYPSEDVIEGEAHEGLWYKCRPVYKDGSNIEELCDQSAQRGPLGEASYSLHERACEITEQNETSRTCPDDIPNWQNAVIGLMIFSAAFGFVAAVLAVLGVCTSPLPKKIYYFHSAGEIFFVCALSTTVALIIYPVAIAIYTDIHSHTLGSGYRLGWGGAAFFFAASFCMSLDELVRESAQNKCCRYICWRTRDRGEQQQV